ncbi:hypothetical protein JTE90_019820 [Oedothorax gibbosus]|uniref:Small ribosomal subunit protein mS25 n=1 Tax=Oedothorax gibbosus TaxID=931172 RepID=A0AAV6V7J7_9ARAC|nr:hypothetical protein JTE90_019820 [Oedothorax gibbosus]
MPYLLGKDAIRRTIPYLKKGKLIFRNNVKVVSIHFNDNEKYKEFNKGASDFVYWHLGQVQYKNPDVQVLWKANQFPTPFIRCWLDTGEDVLMDVFNKSSEQIMSHLAKTLGQPDVQESEQIQEKLDNLCKFGAGRLRHCLCEIPGQVPCSQLVPIPHNMRGKYFKENDCYPPKGSWRY